MPELPQNIFLSTVLPGAPARHLFALDDHLLLIIFFAFGLSFEIPVAILLMVWTGVSTREGLAEKRPYIVVGAFILGMLLTPPDVLSQTLLAVPMWLLFELGLALSRFYQPRSIEESEDQEQKL